MTVSPTAGKHSTTQLYFDRKDKDLEIVLALPRLVVCATGSTSAQTRQPNAFFTVGSLCDAFQAWTDRPTHLYRTVPLGQVCRFTWERIRHRHVNARRT
jgi:hypothetical protein